MRSIFLSIVALLFSSILFAQSKSKDDTDQLIIISPHRKSIQSEIIPLFEKHYEQTYKKKIKVDWLDQGGTSDDVRFVRAKFAGNKSTSGIDIFWGGGDTVFVDMAREGLLQPYELPKELKEKIPTSVGGISLSDSKNLWHGSAISTFGIFFNKMLLNRLKLPEPKTWVDLANPIYIGHLSTTDPRRSGSASTMNYIIVDSLGWDEGWRVLHAIGANTSNFAHSSSDPIKAIVSGNARIAMAIDFYAVAKVAEMGASRVGFNIPHDHAVFNPDPIGILKGAPNLVTAQRFVNYILDTEAQTVLMLPKGSKGGPKVDNLGRLAVNKEAYAQTEGKRVQDFNPFNQKALKRLDSEKAFTMGEVFNDLIGTLMIETHSDMIKAWKTIIANGSKPEDIAAFSKLPATEKEVTDYAKKWRDHVFRNKKLNEWTVFARNKYKSFESNEAKNSKSAKK